MKRITLVQITVLLFAVLSFSSAHAIKKCKDSQGRWHYGDIAVSACEKSKITTLGDRGFIVSEKDAPKTDAELKAEEDSRLAVETEAARVRAVQEEQNRILNVYETEADIDRQRDNQIDSVDGNIAVHKAYLKSMKAKIERLKVKADAATGVHKDSFLTEITDAKLRIEDSNKELKLLDKKKEDVMHRFAREKEVYRELKNQS